jgi:hypothetical protein
MTCQGVFNYALHPGAGVIRSQVADRHFGARRG